MKALYVVDELRCIRKGNMGVLDKPHIRVGHKPFRRNQKLLADGAVVGIVIGRVLDPGKMNRQQ